MREKFEISNFALSTRNDDCTDILSILILTPASCVLVAAAAAALAVARLATSAFAAAVVVT